jgi:hypothetical protein
MDSQYINTLSRRDQLYVHRCRIYLQIETLSDIATADGTKIHDAWKQQEPDKPSRSLLRWPRQAAPLKTAWQIWSKFLDSFGNATGHLKTPLGEWTQPNKFRQHSNYYYHEQQTLWTFQNEMWHRRQLICKHRTFWTFESTATETQQHVPPHVVPIDVTAMTNNQIRTSTAPRFQNDQAPTITDTTPWH